ncbi:brachyurin-like isoform X1 [Zophobas morio]|uniref:brachyurin-like isoform X1 n=1 Tax=Zophobas morio TaxID=2755281 RepID=UPI003083CCAD
MSKTVAVLLVCTSLCVLVNTHPKNKETRIIGGEVARAGQFTWQAAIYVTTADGTYFCGGTIISSQWILTAAQCVYNAIQFTIRLGVFDLTVNDENELLLSTSLYTIHPDYNPLTLEHDVGLIQLHMPITFTDYIEKVDLVNVGQTNVGDLVGASGWGQTSDDVAELSDQLNFVTLVIISNTECQTTYGSQIKDGMLCAIGNYNQGICLGDIGGPIVKPDGFGNAIHAGISSFTSLNGCETLEPSGFTRTDVYREWILNVTGSL